MLLRVLAICQVGVLLEDNKSMYYSLSFHLFFYTYHGLYPPLVLTCSPSLKIYIFFMYFYPIGSYSLVPSLQLPYGLGRGDGRESCVPQNTAKPHCSLNLEANRTNVFEETLSSWRPGSACRPPGHHKELLERNGKRKPQPAKPSLNPVDAGSNPPLTRTSLGQTLP
jgi:hypothetical protein